MAKRKPLTEAAIQEDFDPQAVEQLREQLNLPTVKPSNPLTVPTELVPASRTPRSTPKPGKASSDRPKKINIDIGERRHNRLNEIATRVRGNNSEPVAPSERMYPIHLIQIAIDFLLDGLDLDWDEIHKPEDLREALNHLSVKQLNG
jgi:hypothetical protein